MSDEVNPFSRQNQGPGPYDSQPPVAQQNPIQRPSRGAGMCGIIAGALLVIGLLGLVCCGGFGYFGYTMMKEPVVEAVKMMEADAEISQKLGTPIDYSISFGEHGYTNNNGNGDAHVEFSATGPKGTADVKADLILTNGTWSAKEIVVKYPDGEESILPR